MAITAMRFDTAAINGTIPSTIGLLAYLTSLTIFGSYASLHASASATGAATSSLSGTLPTYLGRLSRLTSLQVYNTLVSGSIPPQLALLTKLAYLQLSDNNLYGSIPSALAQVKSLTSLAVAGNAQLCGSVAALRIRLEAIHGAYFGRDGTGDALDIPTCYASTVAGDAAAMLSLRSTLVGARMDANGWFKTNDPCSQVSPPGPWGGITCTGSGFPKYITAVDLTDWGLQGTIAAAGLGLRALTSLKFTVNAISGR